MSSCRSQEQMNKQVAELEAQVKYLTTQLSNSWRKRGDGIEALPTHALVLTRMNPKEKKIATMPTQVRRILLEGLNESMDVALDISELTFQNLKAN